MVCKVWYVDECLSWGRIDGVGGEMFELWGGDEKID